MENENKEVKNYAQLIAAQNESKRRLRVIEIQDELTDEKKKKCGYAIAIGVCVAGLVVATIAANVDVNQAIQTEIQALNSFDALKEYLSNFTPAMWGTIIATSTAVSGYIIHNRKYKKADKEFYDMMDNQPEDYLNIVEHQAKSM